MIYSTATIPVNPGDEIPLTRDQVWKGLEAKARDARLFLPEGLCSRCEVVEKSRTHFVREATIGGADLREIIVLEPQSKIQTSIFGAVPCSKINPVRCTCASTAISVYATRSRADPRNRPSRRSSTASGGTRPP